MATAVELDDSRTGNHDRTRHELSRPLIVPASRETPAPLACDMMCHTQCNIASGFSDAATMTTLDGVPAPGLSRRLVFHDVSRSGERRPHGTRHASPRRVLAVVVRTD
jgi:hypothetical protein